MKVAKIIIDKTSETIFENVVINELTTFLTEFDELKMYICTEEDREIYYCVFEQSKIDLMVETFKKHNLLKSFEMVDHTESFESCALYEDSTFEFAYIKGIGYFHYNLN